MDRLLSCDHLFGGTHDHCLYRLIALGKQTQEESFRLEAEHFYKCGAFADVMGAASTQFIGDRTVLTMHLH